MVTAWRLVYSKAAQQDAQKLAAPGLKRKAQELLDVIAAEHARALPRPVRILLRGIGAMNQRGGALTSYLLFEQPYTQALMDLGYKDTMARAEEVRAFLVD